MPSWTPEELAAYENRSALRRAFPQSALCHESLAAPKGEATNTGMVCVRIVSFRRRLCDVDNLCPKYFIDCLRYAGIIKDDSPKYITLTVSQEQVRRKADERTEITVDP